MQLSELIVPVKSNNTTNKHFVTTDMFYLPSREDILKQIDFYERRYTSDYAKINARIANNQQTKTVYANSIVNMWTCSGVDLKDEKKVFTFNVEDCSNPNSCLEKSEFKLQKPWQRDLGQGICPQIKMDIDAFLAVQDKFFKTKKDADKFKIQNDFCIKSFLMGDYPKTLLDESDAWQLENLRHDGFLVPTGKFYMGCFVGENNKPIRHAEYVSNLTNTRYVRVNLDTQKESYWFTVEPLEWDILNWSDLPQSINPNGNGTAQHIELVCSYVVNAGIPFFPHEEINAHLWQNSPIRGYLNGYDLKQLKKNINPRYAVGNNYQFSQQNFINEAFAEEKELIRDIDIKTKQQPKKLRIVINHGQGLKINQTSQTHNQII